MNSLDKLTPEIREWALDEIRAKAKGRGAPGWFDERAHKWGKGSGQTHFKRQRYDDKSEAGTFDNEWTAVCPIDGCKYQLGFSCDY